MVSKSIMAVATIILVVVIGGIYFIQQPYTPSETPTSTSPTVTSPTVTPKEITTSTEYWPTKGWKVSTPEQQGMDSEQFVKMLTTIQEQEYDIHSVHVIRNGYMVTDVYFYPFSSDRRHQLHSCTKSITSALVGIAIDKGYIDSVDQPVIDFFPERTAANLDVNKKAMTLEHLLTMTSGLECQDSYLYRWSGLNQMMESDDWVQFMIDIPMVEEPGTRFEYCNGASFLLSAIIQQTTGMNTLDFAHEHLFGPLGIYDVTWTSNPQNIALGYSELRMRPHDMAKIGYLYLNKGMWDGELVISSEWIEMSTRKQINAGTLLDHYGYQWWIDDSGIYTALGAWGQYIMVIPEKNIVTVFTSRVNVTKHAPLNLTKNFIMPAVVSDDSLPDNTESVAKLNALTNEMKQAPDPEPVPPLPEMAQIISGKTYFFNANSLEWQFLSFTFNGKEALSDYSIAGISFRDIPTGLDNVYRFSETPIGVLASKGFWRNESTFVSIDELIGESMYFESEFTFKDDKVTVQTVDYWGKSVTIIGKQMD
ncbi:serine hydrolase domain-containing protein [Thermoproteota archaeon]